MTHILLTGLLTFYAPHVMERVAAYRGLDTACPECIGYAATVDPAYLGRRIWIARPGHRPEGPFLVVDCGNAAHRAQQQARGLIAEVDYPTARRWNMRGPIRARVHLVHPVHNVQPKGAIP